MIKLKKDLDENVRKTSQIDVNSFAAEPSLD